MVVGGVDNYGNILNDLWMKSEQAWKMVGLGTREQGFFKNIVSTACQTCVYTNILITDCLETASCAVVNKQSTSAVPKTLIL